MASRRAKPTSKSSAPIPRVSGHWWISAVIVLACAIAYANSLSNPFIFDDDEAVVANASIRELRSIAVLFPKRELPTAGRPLVNLSFAVNYALGGLDEIGYHIVNIALHVGCALLLFGLVRRTFESSRMPSSVAQHSHSLAFAVALLWALHPLNSEVVDYVTQRTESMMAFCYLLTLYASLRGWSVGAVAACAAGMVCKESMVTAPVMVCLYDRIVMGKRPRWALYAALFATWAVLAGATWWGPRAFTVGFATSVDPWTYLLNQAVMISRYLRLAAWPHALVVAYGAPQPLTLMQVLPQAALLVLLVALTVAALLRWPLIGFAGAWLFITLAPTSSIVPIVTEVGAERRMYLPLVAIVAVAVTGVWIAWQRVAPKQTWLPTAMLAAVALWFGVATAMRNGEYASRMSIAQTVLARWPTDFAHVMVGSELGYLGRRDEAIAEFKRAAEALPIAEYKLGIELFNSRRLDEAVVRLGNYIKREPKRLEAAEARSIIGRAYVLQQRFADAIEQFQQALVTAPEKVENRKFIGDALFGQENFGAAVDAYRAYLAVQPDDFDALMNLASALVNLDDLEGASAEAITIVRLKPNEPAGHHLLARILRMRGQIDDARTEYSRALQLRPGDTELRAELESLER